MTALWRKRVTPSRLLSNDLVAVDSDYSFEATGSLKLSLNQTAKVALVKLNVPSGSRLLSVTLHAGAGAIAANATATTLSIRKVVHTAGGVTDAEVVGVPAVSVVADTKLDIVADCNVVVEENASYYARVTATTANNAACDLEVIGATVSYQ